MSSNGSGPSPNTRRFSRQSSFSRPESAMSMSQDSVYSYNSRSDTPDMSQVGSEEWETGSTSFTGGSGSVRGKKEGGQRSASKRIASSKRYASDYKSPYSVSELSKTIMTKEGNVYIGDYIQNQDTQPTNPNYIPGQIANNNTTMRRLMSMGSFDSSKKKKEAAEREREAAATPPPAPQTEGKSKRWSMSGTGPSSSSSSLLGSGKKDKDKDKGKSKDEEARPVLKSRSSNRSFTDVSASIKAKFSRDGDSPVASSGSSILGRKERKEKEKDEEASPDGVKRVSSRRDKLKRLFSTSKKGSMDSTTSAGSLHSASSSVDDLSSEAGSEYGQSVSPSPSIESLRSASGRRLQAREDLGPVSASASRENLAHRRSSSGLYNAAVAGDLEFAEGIDGESTVRERRKIDRPRVISTSLDMGAGGGSKIPMLKGRGSTVSLSGAFTESPASSPQKENESSVPVTPAKPSTPATSPTKQKSYGGLGTIQQSPPPATTSPRKTYGSLNGRASSQSLREASLTSPTPVSRSQKNYGGLTSPTGKAGLGSPPKQSAGKGYGSLGGALGVPPGPALNRGPSMGRMRQASSAIAPPPARQQSRSDTTTSPVKLSRSPTKSLSPTKRGTPTGTPTSSSTGSHPVRKKPTPKPAPIVTNPPNPNRPRANSFTGPKSPGDQPVKEVQEGLERDVSTMGNRRKGLRAPMPRFPVQHEDFEFPVREGSDKVMRRRIEAWQAEADADQVDEAAVEDEDDDGDKADQEQEQGQEQEESESESEDEEEEETAISPPPLSPVVEKTDDIPKRRMFTTEVLRMVEEGLPSSPEPESDSERPEMRGASGFFGRMLSPLFGPGKTDAKEDLPDLDLNKNDDTGSEDEEDEQPPISPPPSHFRNMSMDSTGSASSGWLTDDEPGATVTSSSPTKVTAGDREKARVEREVQAVIDHAEAELAKVVDEAESLSVRSPGAAASPVNVLPVHEEEEEEEDDSDGEVIRHKKTDGVPPSPILEESAEDSSSEEEEDSESSDEAESKEPHNSLILPSKEADESSSSGSEASDSPSPSRQPSLEIKKQEPKTPQKRPLNFLDSLSSSTTQPLFSTNVPLSPRLVPLPINHDAADVSEYEDDGADDLFPATTTSKPVESYDLSPGSSYYGRDRDRDNHDRDRSPGSSFYGPDSRPASRHPSHYLSESQIYEVASSAPAWSDGEHEFDGDEEDDEGGHDFNDLASESNCSVIHHKNRAPRYEETIPEEDGEEEEEEMEIEMVEMGGADKTKKKNKKDEQPKEIELTELKKPGQEGGKARSVSMSKSVLSVSEHSEDWEDEPEDVSAAAASRPATSAGNKELNDASDEEDVPDHLSVAKKSSVNPKHRMVSVSSATQTEYNGEDEYSDSSSNSGSRAVSYAPSNTGTQIRHHRYPSSARSRTFSGRIASYASTAPGFEEVFGGAAQNVDRIKMMRWMEDQFEQMYSSRKSSYAIDSPQLMDASPPGKPGNLEIGVGLEPRKRAVSFNPVTTNFSDVSSAENEGGRVRGRKEVPPTRVVGPMVKPSLKPSLSLPKIAAPVEAPTPVVDKPVITVTPAPAETKKPTTTKTTKLLLPKVNIPLPPKEKVEVWAKRMSILTTLFVILLAVVGKWYIGALQEHAECGFAEDWRCVCLPQGRVGLPVYRSSGMINGPGGEGACACVFVPSSC